MIIQELNLIQERCGWLPEAELRELSERINQPLHRLHEVASFYPLYRLQPPPVVDVKVCRDMACHLHGAPHLQASLEAYGRELNAEGIKVDGVSCLGQCDRTIPCTINDHVYWSKSEKDLRALIAKANAQETLPHQHADRNSLGWKIDPYDGQPAYEAIRQFVADRNHKKIIDELEASHLRGMGGAGFPTFKKWSFVRGAPGTPKYVVCNADESEPGTFKDRELLRRTPHLVIEGMTLAGLVTGAQQGWLYLRHEYHDELEAFEEALEKARELGVIGDNILGSGLAFKLEVFVSPGGYIQGEETALLEAMEDRRGEPRNKPPFPVTHGLFSKPTVINNVETLAWVPAIVKRGGAWYRDSGVNGATGLRFVSISGDVVKPGVYEVPFGQTVRELVFDTAGGMRGNQQLQAIAPSGPSGGFLPAEIPFGLLTPKFVQEKKVPDGQSYDILNLPLDLNTLGSMNGMLGAAFVVYGHRCNIVENALNCVEFFRNESCGKCVPCRLGSQKLTDIIKAILQGKFPRSDLELVNEVSTAMTMASICGLGQVASNPIASVIKYFRAELLKFLK